MSNDVQYNMEMIWRTKHRVGYAPVSDIIFEYWYEGDLMLARNSNFTDAILCYEMDRVDLTFFIDLGEL